MSMYVYVCICIYRIYDAPYVASDSFAVNLVNCLESLFNTATPIFVIGDLNCPNINCYNYTAPADSVLNAILDFFISKGCVQFVRQPTHLNKLLDVVLVNEPILMYTVEVDQTFSSSDHCSVNFTVSIIVGDDDTPVDTNDIRYNWKDVDWDGMTGYLNEINWYELFTVNFTADSLWKSFSSILYDAINCFVSTRVGLRKAKTKTLKLKPILLK